MNKSKQLAKNVLYVYLRVGIVTILGLVTARLSFNVLGQSDYGLFNVVGGIISILAIINTAMSTTVRRYINVELGKENGNPNKIFNTCLVINMGLALLLFILAETIGLWYIYHYLNVAADKFNSALTVFHICTLTSALSLVNVPHQSLLAAHEHFKAVAIIDIGTQVLKLGGVTCLYLISSNRVVWYAALVCGMMLVSLTAYSLYCRLNWSEIVKFRIWKDSHLYREIVVFNNYIALGASSYVGRAQGSNMLINYFFGTMVNGAFSIAYMIEGYAMTIVSNLTTAAGPRITKEFSSGEINNALRTASFINKLSINVMLLLVFTILIELPFLLKLWLGRIPQGCLILCQFTLISAVTRSLSEGLPPLIQASGKIKWFQIFSSCLQISVLPIGWILFKKGFPPQSIIVIFIVATFINFVVNLLLMRVILSWQEIKYFIKSSVTRSVIVAAIFIAYYIANKTLFPDIYPILNIVICFLFALSVIYFVSLDLSEQRAVVSLIGKRFVKK